MAAEVLSNPEQTSCANGLILPIKCVQTVLKGLETGPQQCSLGGKWMWWVSKAPCIHSVNISPQSSPLRTLRRENSPPCPHLFYIQSHRSSIFIQQQVYDAWQCWEKLTVLQSNENWRQVVGVDEGIMCSFLFFSLNLETFLLQLNLNLVFVVFYFCQSHF